MNNDLISRSALLVVPNVCKVTEYDESGCGISYLAVSVDAIEAAPAVDAEVVRHGRWTFPWTSPECSACRKTQKWTSNYCPNCGAKMDAEVEG
jgi:hypothetical protein